MSDHDADPSPDPEADHGRRLLSRRALITGGFTAAVGVGAVLIARADRDRRTRRPPATTTTSLSPTSIPTSASTSTLPPEPEPDPDHFDLADFGARGGDADDSAALAAALAATIERSRVLNRSDGAERFATLTIPSGAWRCPTLDTVTVDAPIALRGAAGAELDATGRDRDEPLLRCTSSIDAEAVGFRRGARWFDFSDITADFGLLRLVGCTFTEAGAPAYAWKRGALEHGPDRLVVDRNRVHGGDGPIDRRGSGFYLAFHRWGSASVSDNTITGVRSQGIRIGDMDREGGRPYADRPGLVCTGNEVSDVLGTDRAYGIIAQGSHMVIADNQVSDVASGDGGPIGASDTEGIYVKGHDIEIRGNRLVDAGRSQGQITVKSDATLVVDNHVTFETSRAGSGIRMEGVGGEVRGNTIENPPPRWDTISIQAEPTDDTIVIADNRIVGGAPRRAIVVDRRAEARITGNHLDGLDSTGPLVLVRTFDDGDTREVVVEGNRITGSPRAPAVAITARGGAIDHVTITGNELVDVARALDVAAYRGGRIDAVVIRDNSYDGVDAQPRVIGSVPIDSDE